MPIVNETDLKRLLELSASDTKRHFDVIAERLEKKFDSVAEGLTQLNGKLDREVVGLGDEVRRGFADTQAMIKFSHAELDRRVRALEQGVQDLQARMDRIETGSSSH